jgi:hypothetical protein
MSNAWTPNAVANALLRLAAGLMLLAALGLGALSVGSYLWTKATAQKTVDVDWSTPKSVSSFIPD